MTLDAEKLLRGYEVTRIHDEDLFMRALTGDNSSFSIGEPVSYTDHGMVAGSCNPLCDPEGRTVGYVVDRNNVTRLFAAPEVIRTISGRIESLGSQEYRA